MSVSEIVLAGTIVMITLSVGIIVVFYVRYQKSKKNEGNEHKIKP